MKTKYIKNISKILKLAEIQNLSSVSPADCVQIVGDVVSVPKALTKEFDGFSLRDVRVGDVVMFSHDVIYSFGSTAPEEDPIYKNQFHYNGQEYFVCNPRNLYAVIRGGDVRMQNGYVMVEEIKKPTYLHLPEHLRKLHKCSFGTVTKIGHPMTTEKAVDVMPGDIVFFPSTKIRLYQINDKPFGILKQSQLLAKKLPPPKDPARLN